MKKNLTLLLIGISVIFSVNQASATIGYSMLSSGLKVGTAGAGSAFAMDATDCYVNPALVTYLPNQFFISGGVFHLERSMDTSAAPNPPGFGNPAGYTPSKTVTFPDGSLGFRCADCCSCWSFGLSITGNGGMHTWYPNARTSFGQAGNFDHGIKYRIVNVNPAWALCLMNGCLSLGITPNLSYSDISTDSATIKGVETEGANGTDSAFGAGLRLGMVFKPNCMWSFSLTGQTPTYYQRFNKYRDLFISAFNYPANFTAGLAFEPWCGTTLLFDYQYIYHKGTKLLRVEPENGGFGWKNMNVFRIGLVQDFNCFTARLGYSYGKSPIDSEHVFANVIAPAIVEHHIAAGLTYYINCCNNISLSGYYVPKKRMTDSGKGDAFSQAGKGTKISISEWDVQLAYQYTF